MRKGSFMSESNTRAELFAALQSLSEIIPEMRAGQLVAAIGEVAAADPFLKQHVAADHRPGFAFLRQIDDMPDGMSRRLIDLPVDLGQAEPVPFLHELVRLRTGYLEAVARRERRRGAVTR